MEDASHEISNNSISQVGSDINGNNHDQLGKGVAINKDGSRVIAGGYGGNAKVYENNNGSCSIRI